MSEVTFTFSGKMIPAGLNPTHEDIFGKGGFVALTGDASSLLNESLITTFLNESIIEQRRKVGMLVYISSLNQYYTCSDTSGSWDRKYFSGRYFYGPSAPTVSDVTIGEKWFNTTVGSEFTYLPTDEDQDTFFWVDIDHLGQGETGFVRISGDVMTGALTTPFVTMTQGFTSSNGFIGTLTGTSASLSSLTASNGFIGTLTGTSASLSSLTASNGFIGTLTGNNASLSSLTASNGFIGTLTGTNASFAGLTTSNGFIGTLTGTDASFDTVDGSTGVFTFLGVGSDSFDAQSLIDPTAGKIVFGVTGGRNSYFDTNVTIGASGSTGKGWLWVRGGLDDSVNSFVVEGNSVLRDEVEIGKDPYYALILGTTSGQGTQNPNVPIIKSRGGVLIGGNTISNNNWLGNNVYLSPEGYSFVGFPNDVPTSWFDADGGTYPFNPKSLNVTGGIHTDNAYRYKNTNDYLDSEFVRKDDLMIRPTVDVNDYYGSYMISSIWHPNSITTNTLVGTISKNSTGINFPVDVKIYWQSNANSEGKLGSCLRWRSWNNLTPSTGQGGSFTLTVMQGKTISSGGTNMVDHAQLNNNNFEIARNETYNNGAFTRVHLTVFVSPSKG